MGPVCSDACSSKIKVGKAELAAQTDFALLPIGVPVQKVAGAPGEAVA